MSPRMIDLPDAGTGYLASPAHGSGPGVLVVHDSSGLVTHVTDICDRLAAEGFVALAPDLCEGGVEADPDAAQKRSGPGFEGMAAVLATAAGALQASDAVRGRGLGAVGFGLGGGLALVLATRQRAVRTCVTYDAGMPGKRARPEPSTVTTPVLGHFADAATSLLPGDLRALVAELAAGGGDSELFVYPGAGPGFHDARSEGHDEESASLAWIRTLSFLRAHLG